MGAQPGRNPGVTRLCRRALLWGALLLGSAPAAALFTRTELERIDHEPLLDSEYFLDLLSFSYPVIWDDLWHASTVPAYRINAASLDCCDLMIRQELRLKKSLTPSLEFKFRLLQDEDKVHRDFHYQLELEKKLWRGWSASVLGEPTFRKEDSDIGFGLAYEQSRAWRAEARHTFVDFNFNKRNSTSRSYDAYPATDEFSIDARAGPDWRASAYLEIDSPLRLQIPDENRTFSYRRTTARLRLRREPARRFSYMAGYGYEFEAKGDVFDPLPANKISLSARRQAHQVLAALEGRVTDRDRLEAGQAFLLRAARADNANDGDAGIFYSRWEAQPYARWRREVKEWLTTELAAFLSFGENRQRGAKNAVTLSSRLAEAKLGAGTDFVFGASGRIGLYGAFDLDGPGHLWDGGNIRAMFFF